MSTMKTNLDCLRHISVLLLEANRLSNGLEFNVLTSDEAKSLGELTRSVEDNLNWAIKLTEPAKTM